MKKLMIGIPLTILSFFGHLHAEEMQTDKEKIQDLEQRLLALEKKIRLNRWEVPPTTSNWVKKGYNITLSGSALFWNAREEGLDTVIEAEPSAGFIIDAKTHHLHMNWDWGFRLAMNYQSPHRRMDLNLLWTRFYPHGQQAISTEGSQELFSIWSAPAASLSAGAHSRAHWRMRLNLLSLEIGGQFHPRKWLEVRPHIGATSAWIDQTFDIDLKGAFSRGLAVKDDIDMKNDFFGAGLRGGVDSAWRLNYGLSVYGNAAFSILYGFFNTHQEESLLFLGTNSSEDVLDEKDHFRIGRTILELAFGFRWDRMLKKQRYHLGLQTGWEQFYFFGQNQLKRFTDDVDLGANVPVKGDLTLQGWTFRASLGF